jgi:hypothetical protein
LIICNPSPFSFNMKLFLILSSLFAAANAGTTFGITGGAAPGSWDVDEFGSNTVSFGFDLAGEDPTDFISTAYDCGNTGDYTLATSTGDGAGVDATFDNAMPIVNTVYCVTVELAVIGANNNILVASSQFTYDVTAPAGGSITVNPAVTSANLQILTNTGGVGGGGAVGTRAAPTITSSVEPAVINFGATGTLNVQTSAYYIEIVSVTGGNVVFVPDGPTSGDISFPLSTYQGQADVTLYVEVEWNVFDPIRRRLGEEMNEETAGGTETVEVTVGLTPLEDSGAYEAKITSMAALTVGGAAIALVL